MPRISHFEFAAEKPERAQKFFEKAFGWKMEKWENPGMEYWMITTGPKGEVGINGGMMKRSDAMSPTPFTIAVKDLDAQVRNVVAAGGKITVQKSAIPGVGWFAKFADTEGNEFGLMQTDMAVK